MNPRRRRHLKLQAKLKKEKLQEKATTPAKEAAPKSKRQRTKKASSAVADSKVPRRRPLDAPGLPEE